MKQDALIRNLYAPDSSLRVVIRTRCDCCNDARYELYRQNEKGNATGNPLYTRDNLPELLNLNSWR